MNRRKTFFIVSILLIFCSFCAFGFELEGLQFDAGLFWMHNEVYDSAPGDIGNDTLVFSLGGTVPMELTRYMTLNPSLFLHFNTYKYIEHSDLSMPIDPANAHSFYVSGIFLNIPVGFKIPFKKLSFGGQLGPAFRFMIPLYGEVESDRNLLAASFYKEARFIYLSAGLWLDYRFSKRLSLFVRGDYYFPLYNAWTQDNLPFSEGMAVFGSLGIKYSFKNSPKKESHESLPDDGKPDDSEQPQPENQ